MGKFVKGAHNECWLWRAACFPSGYGIFTMPGRRHGIPARAHRVAWELTHGAIPAGMFVCHRCDNPPCVNPAHLFLGTPADNSADRNAKGRQARGERARQRNPARGERNANAKLTSGMVAQIKALRASGLSQQAIADRMGTVQTTISRVLLGQTWRHVVVA